MPRTRRKISDTGIYHIMIRGNEKKNIFLDDNDRKKFIRILYKIKLEKCFDLFAYCIMKNHVHLIIKDNSDDISTIMKMINTSYAIYFNYKYDRVGHVFQDRFKSEVIENDRYLLCAIRYVHNNPVKANFCNNPLSYKWSSYKEYITTYKYMTDIDFPLSLYDDNKGKAISLLKSFTLQDNNDKFMDIKENDFKQYKLKTFKECEEYIEIYCKNCGINFNEILEMEYHKKRKKELIKTLRKSSTLSVGELKDIFKVSKSTIYRT